MLLEALISLINLSRNKVTHLLSFPPLSKIAPPFQPIRCRSKTILWLSHTCFHPKIYHFITFSSRIFTVHSPRGFSSQNSTVMKGQYANRVPSSPGLLASSREVVPLGEMRSITRSPRRRWSIDTLNWTCSSFPMSSLSLMSYLWSEMMRLGHGNEKRLGLDRSIQ